MSEATHFSRALKRLRTSRHISQAELARAVGVSQQAVASWESGDSSPDPAMLCLLAASLDVPLTDLLDYEAIATRVVDFVTVTTQPSDPRMLTTESILALRRIPKPYMRILWDSTSMEPRYQRGSRLTLRRGEPYYKRGYGIIELADGNYCFARYDRQDDRLLLRFGHEDLESLMIDTPNEGQLVAHLISWYLPQFTEERVRPQRRPSYGGASVMEVLDPEAFDLRR